VCPSDDDSNFDLGDCEPPDPPEDLTPKGGTGWVLLSHFATEHMAITRQQALAATDARSVRRCLCRWWGDVSGYAVEMGLEPEIAETLDMASHRAYAAAGSWFDGCWHPSADLMVEILWRLRLPRHVVGAAYELHQLAQKEESDSHTMLSWVILALPFLPMTGPCSA
jgi:hypothetical protein